ncbi:MAG: SusC/RagA family TonB-linked outer membrane protein, partial [Gemmatimonadota bacterium]|nr:SusC/RagA family TonB-linked outer membrane protein [Gemmatimonadota bacterium]
MLFDWSGRWTKRASALATTALSAWLFIGAAPLFAQGAITGTVVDAETLAPVAGAQVFVTGTVVGTLTGAQGTYRLEGVPAGQQTITVRLIGYRENSQTVTVTDGQVATADFQVEQTALRLQDIVVTGVVGETPRVKLPFTVERLDPQDLPVPAADASSLLAGKAAGVSVVSGSGQPGQAAGITLRGPTSIDASGRTQAPLIVIDGVIQSESATLSDIGSLDIDHVEIVKGAAAASLYGSRAQNGVIQISTKRGTGLQTNSFDILARGEYGFGQLEGDIQLTSTHPFQLTAGGDKFLDSDGNAVDFTDLGRPGFGSPVFADDYVSSTGETQTPSTTFNDNPHPGQLFDHIDTFFDPGETFDVYAAVTGRFGESSFRVSFDEFKETGVVSCDVCESNLAALNADRVNQGLSPFDVRSPTDDGYERQNVRLNVDTRFGAVDIAASGFYSRSTQDDAAVANGSFFSLTFMSPALDLTQIDPSDGYPIIDIDPLSLEENPLYQLAVSTEEDERTRTMGSVDVTFSPEGLEWLTLEANASYDRTDFEDIGIRPKNEKTSSAGENEFTGGSLRKFNFRDEAINASATIGASHAFMDGDLTARAKFRYLVEDQDFESNGAFGSRFSVQDVPNFAAIEGQTTANNQIREIRAEGLFAIASVDYKGRYIIDGLVRRDGSSLFGPEERWHTYYRGSAAWRVSQEDFWNIDAIDELKFRFSYGTAGGRPNFFAQYETFGVSAGAIFPINLGNRALKPEFTVEREAGVNLVLFENLGIDYTYAWATTDDQLLRVPQPAFVGFSSQWQNAGEIEAETHEVSLRYSAIDNRDVGLQFRLNWDKTDQVITRLDVPDFTQAGNFFVSEGAPLGELWGDKWASSCAAPAPMGVSASDCAANFQVNDDGLLVPTGGAAFTDGIAQGLWGTTVSVGTDDGTETYAWGFPVKTQDYSPACVRKNPSSFQTECDLQEFLPFGNTTPDWNASFATNFRYKGIAVNGLLEASVGHSIYNNTRQWALRELRGGDVDQAGKSEGLKKPIGYYSAVYDVNATNSFFREDGDWVKLREIALGYTLPQSVMEDLFQGVLDRVTLNVIGRNLLTIT